MLARARTLMNRFARKLEPSISQDAHWLQWQVARTSALCRGDSPENSNNCD